MGLNFSSNGYYYYTSKEEIFNIGSLIIQNSSPLVCTIVVPKGSEIVCTSPSEINLSDVSCKYKTQSIFVKEKFHLLTTEPQILLLNDINIFNENYLSFLLLKKKYDWIRWIIQLMVKNNHLGLILPFDFININN